MSAFILAGCQGSDMPTQNTAVAERNIGAIADAYVAKRNPKLLREYPDREISQWGGKWIVGYYNSKVTDRVGGGATVTIDTTTREVDGFWLGQ